MIKERLVIENFGPVKSVSLNLGRFNILTGEQATGKSTVAKILAVCRYFSYIYGREEQRFMEGLEAWGLKESFMPESRIEYSCAHYRLTIAQGVPVVEPLTDAFKALIAVMDEMSSLLDVWEIPVSFYQNNVAKIMDNPFYLPAERGLQSIYSIGKSSIQNISDSLFNQFARLDQVAKQFKGETDISPLGIFYKNDDGRGFIRKHNEDKYYSLYHAATGYQSTIPVVLLIKYYSEIRKKHKTFIIEEPELNLFPAAQHELVKYLVAMAVQYQHMVLITTHSPYILTSLNNLMYAYRVGQKNTEAVHNVLEKQYWINPQEVSAYRLMPDGTARDIIDESLQEINAGELDGISRSVNEVWDKLAEIEYEKS